ncbi:uncharacterized protein LOC123439909 [Hordeum vulgare subsp. vulgare]|uniref:Predicted protein n=1 Tax=Hordeum vulgare subsp. vulgare TaxID=112509 RepID=F2EIV5_HORVV|nr:uncharacterized protein LOC123439909 [Hordeum vulgare subsp. vulgare]XP_044972467.1 uncharacterized protein LOC123439909 [Hordeum vulgare subsp. vulgare]BAK07277.1 predicted protein [Hordeum vulgare subsp. vulgare]
MEVNKGWNITEIGGDEWDRLIARMHLTWGESISFSFGRGTPRLAIIYLNYEEEHDDPRNEVVFSQRLTRQSENETDTLWEKLPPRDAYVVMPFVTCLTRMMVNRHVMKLPNGVCVSYGIKPYGEGIARLRLTLRGSVTTSAYAVPMDGCTIFSAAGWSNFLTWKNRLVRQAILVTTRNTPESDLRMMIVIDLL